MDLNPLNDKPHQNAGEAISKLLQSASQLLKDKKARTARDVAGELRLTEALGTKAGNVVADTILKRLVETGKAERDYEPRVYRLPNGTSYTRQRVAIYRKM